MKIGETSNQFPEFPERKKIKEKPSASSARSLGLQKQEVEFKDSLFNAAETTIRSSLDELMGEVQAQGERLARHQNFEELAKYKELVRSFLAKAAKDLYRLQASDGGSGNRPGAKVYVILEKVDLELEKLAKLVLAGQTPQLRILEKLDQIKGLLLDAYK